MAREGLTTALGRAMRERRGRRSQQHAAAEVGIAQGTFSRFERGLHRPNGTMARMLAEWLGWTEDQVHAAAEDDT